MFAYIPRKRRSQTNAEKSDQILFPQWMFLCQIILLLSTSYCYLKADIFRRQEVFWTQNNGSFGVFLKQFRCITLNEAIETENQQKRQKENACRGKLAHRLSKKCEKNQVHKIVVLPTSCLVHAFMYEGVTCKIYPRTSAELTVWSDTTNRSHSRYWLCEAVKDQLINIWTTRVEVYTSSSDTIRFEIIHNS